LTASARPFSEKALAARVFNVTWKERLVPNLQAVLRQEIQRLARREVRSELEATKKAVSKHRHDIAELKRRNTDLERKVSYLESRESKRLKARPSKAKPPKGTRFSVRSLKAQRAKSGLSQGDYAKLVGVSASTIYNWESGTAKPTPKHLATLVSLRGLGKREAQKRLELVTAD
jgi:DNA-binding transcriptional regulator YiaG